MIEIAHFMNDLMVLRDLMKMKADKNPAQIISTGELDYLTISRCPCLNGCKSPECDK